MEDDPGVAMPEEKRPAGHGGEEVAVETVRAGARDYPVKGTLAEIETQRRSESASRLLRESEDRPRAVTASATDAILTMDAEGLISHWNPAAEPTSRFE